MQDTNTGTELIDLPPSDELPTTLQFREYKPEIPDAEIKAMAKRLSQDYKARLEYYTSEKRRKDFPDKPLEEFYADAADSNAPCEALAKQYMDSSPEQISWQSLDVIFDYNPELFLRKWEELKFYAGVELKGGITAYEACKAEGDPYEKAQFLALRDELADEWNPRNGIERNLIDQMAQAYTMVLYWQHIMLRWMNFDTPPRAKSFSEQYGEKEQTPRLSTFEAVNRAADMIDKFQRMFLRTLRALQNMRRYAPVIVQNAGQVNVGQQQVNVSQPAGG